MRIQQFEIEEFRLAKLEHVNLRVEMAGLDRIPACDLRFTVAIDSEDLAMFGPHLHDSLFWNSGEVSETLQLKEKPNLRNPMLGPLALKTELAGYELTLDMGLGGKSNITLEQCVAKKFRIECVEGGMARVTFVVQAHASEKSLGRIGMLVGTEVSIKFLAPEYAEVGQ